MIEITGFEIVFTIYLIFCVIATVIYGEDMLLYGMYDNHKCGISVTLRDIIMCIVTLPTSLSVSLVVAMARGTSKLWQKLDDIKIIKGE